jgi:hypothetical protein
MSGTLGVALGSHQPPLVVLFALGEVYKALDEASGSLATIHY